MNEKSYQQPLSDDIDLVILLERVILYFRRYKFHFVLAVILGIAVGLAGYFIFPKLYKSRMILHSSIVTNAEQIQVIDNWDELLKRHEYDVLASLFNCRKEVVLKLASLDAAEVQKVFTPNNPNGFYIDVKITDNSILDELQKGIVFGLNNAEYTRERVEVRREDLRTMITKVRTEISKLDSTKNTIENIISNKEKNSSSLMLDVSGINGQVIGLNEKLLAYIDELKFTEGVMVLQGFTKLKTPVSFSWKVMILLGLVLTLTVTYIFTLFHHVNQRLKQLPSSNPKKSP